MVQSTDLVEVSSTSTALSTLLEQYARSGAETCIAEAVQAERSAGTRKSESDGGVIRLRKNFHSPSEVKRWGPVLKALVKNLVDNE